MAQAQTTCGHFTCFPENCCNNLEEVFNLEKKFPTSFPDKDSANYFKYFWYSQIVKNMSNILIPPNSLKHFKYFWYSQIVADTRPKGAGRALVENLPITGVVKAGRGSVKGLPADYLSEQPIN